MRIGNGYTNEGCGGNERITGTTMGPTIEHRFETILEMALTRAARLREMIQARLGDGPYVGNCDTCGEKGQRTLDMTETAVRTGNDGPLWLVWTPCVECWTRERLQRAGVPENLLPARLDNWQVTDERDGRALERVREFAQGSHAVLMIESPEFGNGKSHLAVGVMRAFIERGRSVRFWTQARFLRDLRKRYDDRKAEDVVEAAQQCGLLVLDDIGLSVGGRDETPTLHEVLDERYGSKRPTVMTTNLQPEAFGEVIGPRMANRLREAMFGWIRIHGPSRRAGNRTNYLQG